MYFDSTKSVNDELWVIIMCQWRLIDCKKCTMLVRMSIMAEFARV